VAESIREHKRLRRLLLEITQLQLARIAAYSQHVARRGNRP
jgi:hypothetical protein